MREGNDIKNVSNTIATTWEEYTALIELDRKHWLTTSIKDEGWLQKNFSMGHVIGTALKNSATPMVFSIYGLPIFTFNPYFEDSMPKPREEVLKGWEPLLKYLPNWQEKILNTPGELKALFQGNKNFEPELMYLLLMKTRLEQLSIQQAFELMEAVSGRFLHAWLLKDKKPQDIEKNILAQKDKPFYRVYLYAAAKAACYEEEQSANQLSWWGVSKSQRVYVADLLMKTIYENKRSEYHYGCNNGFSGLVRKLYMQMLDEHALTNSSTTENNAIKFARYPQLI